MIESIVWLIFAIIVLGCVWWFLTGYIIPVLPAPVRGPVQALCALVAILVILGWFTGYVPGPFSLHRLR